MQPSYHERQLAWLSESLGVRIECADAQTPRPGLTQYRDLRLLEQETGKPLATLDSLRVISRDGRRAANGGRLSLPAELLPRLGQAVSHALRQGELRPFELPIAEVVLDDLTWSDMVLAIDVGPARQRSIELRSASPDGVVLRVERNRQISPPQTRLTLDTGARPLPWRVVAGLTPLPNNLGPKAALTGQLSQISESHQGQLTGSLTGVDLGRLAPPEAQVSTTAAATLSSASLAWRGNRVTEMNAEVVAAHGEVALWFADTVRCYLHCPMVGSLSDDITLAKQGRLQSDSPVKFDQLAFRLHLDAGGLRITGTTERQQHGLSTALMKRGGEQLLFEPRPGPPTPVEALLQVVKSPFVESPEFCPRARALSERLPISREATRLR